MLIFEAACRSDRGDREKNEDRTLIAEEAGIFALADGMGGERGGEVASQLAVDTVQRSVESGRLRGAVGEAGFAELNRLFGEVNAAILEVCREIPTLAGMGTTLTLALTDAESLSFAHVGDSRLYLWREGECRQLTRDHTEAQEMVDSGSLTPEEGEKSRFRHVLSRSLGTIRQALPECGHLSLRAGDRLLLCSDGLYGPVPLPQLGELLGGPGAAGRLADELVAAARNSGRTGLDNITGLVVKVDDRAA